MTSEHNEGSPLLRADNGGSDRKHRLSIATRITIAISSLLLLFVIEIADLLLTVPRAEVEEHILCRKQFPDAVLGSNDPRCKNDNVQSELSILQSTELSCALLPGLLTAVPWGVVADKRGRIFVLRLTVLGLVLYEGANVIICRFPDIFPVQLVWASPVFLIIGGGASMASAMIFTVASDISSEAQRATTFFYLGAATMIADLVSKPITYLAMQKSIWFSIYLGYSFLVICLVSVAVLPSILMKLGKFEPTTQEQEPEHVEEYSLKTSPLAALRQHVSSGVGQIADSFRFLFWDNKKLGLVLLSIMFTTLGKGAGLLLLQYITKRFGWDWSQANLLLSVNSATKLGLVLVILPAIAQFLLDKIKLPSLDKDLWISRGSVVLLIAGAFVMGLADSPPLFVIGLVLFALGSGYSLSAKSLLATVAGGHHVAMLFTTVSFVEMSGILIASPVLATSFRIGLKWDGAWVGLPFLSAACLFALSAIIIIGVSFGDADRVERLPPRQHEDLDEEDE